MEILAVGLTSLVTVWCVVLSNRSAMKRLADQQHHEWSMQREERRQGIRRTVFEEALESVSRACVGLLGMASLDTSDREARLPFEDQSAAVDKVGLVGSIGTLEAVVDLSVEIGAQFAALYSKRLQVQSLRVHAAEIGQLHENAFDEYLSAMEQLAELPDGPAVEKAVKDSQKPLEQLRQDLFEAEERHFQLHAELIDECRAAYRRLLPLMSKALASARSELDFAPSEKTMTSIYERFADRVDSIADLYQLDLPGPNPPLQSDRPSADR